MLPTLKSLDSREGTPIDRGTVRGALAGGGGSRPALVAHGKNALRRACPGVRASCVPACELEIPEVREAHWPARKSEAQRNWSSVPGRNSAPSVPVQGP